MLDSNQKKIAASVVSYFEKKGYSKAQASGIAGNMFVESKFNIGAVNPNDVGKQSIGLCQWRAERNANLREYAKKNGKSWTNLDLQLSFTSQELSSSEKSTPGAVKSTSTPEEAALAWAKSFERCSSASYNSRKSAAKEIYNGVTTGKWEAGEIEDTENQNNKNSEDSSVSYETVNNENTNFQDASANNYDKDSNIPSNSQGDFVQLTGQGINWENDDNLIVFETEAGSEEKEQEVENQTFVSANPGVKPPTLSQKFGPSISISEHSFPASSMDESEQHSVDEGSGQSTSYTNFTETFSV